MSDRDYVPGYWERVWADFRRSRLALLGMAVIGFVLAIAVLCPLLANSRPLYIRATFPGDYTNSVAIVLEQLALLSAPAPGERAQQARDLAEENFRALKLHLTSDALDQAEALHDRFRQALAATPLDVSAMKALQADLEKLFDAPLQPVARYPAIRSLTSGEIYSLGLFLAALLWLLTARRLPRVRSAWPLVFLLPVLLVVLWKAAFPTVKDTLPYRRVINEPQFRQKGGAVLTPPIFYGENENILSETRQPPTWMIPPEKRLNGQNWHWLGTDTNGRDVLTRMIYGARVSMLVGILAVSLYTAIGIVLGALAGYFRGWVDIVLSRIIEALICFPALVLILAVQAFLAPSLLNIILALALLMWTTVARLQRAEFLRLVNLDFVQSVRALGGSHLRIIFVHILPNA